MLLSGCVGFGEEYTRVAGFSNRDVGAICLKGTTGKRRASATRRTASTRPPMGMLNAIGLQNPGVDHVVRRDPADAGFHRDALHRQCLAARRSRNTSRSRARFDDSPIDAIEINISCPNVKEGGVQFGN